MKPGQIISLMSDVFSDYPVKYSIVMIDATKDPLLTLPTLNYLERDGVHNRGTYPNANRIITVTDPVGTTPSRLVLGDNNTDKNLSGTDALSGTEASNSGNFGVVYKITLTRVAPNTLITLNPRAEIPGTAAGQRQYHRSSEFGRCRCAAPEQRAVPNRKSGADGRNRIYPGLRKQFAD